jgi:hypothetical protein
MPIAAATGRFRDDGLELVGVPVAFVINMTRNLSG